MKKLILIKYASEIFLKGLNRNKFEKKLMDNISCKLEGLNFKIVSDQNRYFIEVEELDEAINRITKVFGVAEVCVVTKIERDFHAIKNEALKKMENIQLESFKVVTNRADKSFPMESMKVSREVGAHILRNTSKNLKVDVKNPEVVVNIEIRKEAYIWTSKDKIKGAGGLPYGINGSTMLMLSGGIDSPVAPDAD